MLTAMIGLLAEWNVHQSIENVWSQPTAETIGVRGISLVGESSADHLGESNEAPPGATALLLDDKPATRELNGAYLRQAGWRVLTAGSCEEARSKLSTEIDVVLLNLYIQDGANSAMFEFVRDARGSSPPPEIIFLTSAEADVGIAFATRRNGSPVHRFSEPSAHLLDTALRALHVRRRTAAGSGA